MNGNIYVVYTKKDKTMGLYAVAEKIPRCNNLVDYAKDCVSLNVCNTYKEALKIATQWNKDFRNNGKQKSTEEW